MIFLFKSIEKIIVNFLNIDYFFDFAANTIFYHERGKMSAIN